jgi:ankyrin repeat protein
MYAFKIGNVNSVDFLSMQRSQNLNEEDFNSLTILMHTLFESNLKMARKLLKRGADIDYVNENGNTVLHMCVYRGLKDSVKFLLNSGANQHIMDSEGKDACDLAKSNNMVIKLPIFNNCNF